MKTLNVIVKLSGFEYPYPDEYTVPTVKRTVGPMAEIEAEARLTQSGFTRKHVREWFSGKGVFQRKVDGKPVAVDVACVFATVQIIDSLADVAITDPQ